MKFILFLHDFPLKFIQFLEGKDAELQASRQAGLLDFIASALPASHTSKPEACQVTIYLLRLLRTVLSVPANRCYFLVQNLLPPVIPMLAVALENYIKIAASSTTPGQTNKTSIGNLESISEIVDGFLWAAAAIIGCGNSNEIQLQMQDGLVELVIAYQVIHRLRDLFALYDRPQVEGSPFPSSILLSINLLVVLTSKFRGSSSIDWESFPGEVLRGIKLEDIEVPDSADVISTTCNSSRTLFPPTSGMPGHLPDVSECTSLDNKTAPSEETGAITLIGTNLCDGDHIALEMKRVNAMDVLSSVPTNDKRECVSVQKIGSNSASNGAEQVSGNGSDTKNPAKFLLSAMGETGLVCLPSMLTAVLLQANNNRLSAEQVS